MPQGIQVDKQNKEDFCIQLNLHSALQQLSNKVRQDEDRLTECTNEIPDTNNCDTNQNNDVEGNDENNYEGKDEGDMMYHITYGNNSYMLVNQVADYNNRGEGLSEMCLYGYCSKVYKTRFTDEDEEKAILQKKKMVILNQKPKH